MEQFNLRNHPRFIDIVGLYDTFFSEQDFLEKFVKESEEYVGAKKDDPLMFYRRTYIRTMMAVMDGIMTCMRQLLLDAHADGTIVLTVREIKLLEKGHDAPEAYYKNTAKACARLLEQGEYNAAKIGGDGFNNFVKCVPVRHRLVHPKCEKDFYVLKAEEETMRLAVADFVSTVGPLCMPARLVRKPSQ